MPITAGLSALTTVKSLYEIIRDAREKDDPTKLRTAFDQMLDVALAAREQVFLLSEERNAAVQGLAEAEQEIKRMTSFDESADDYIAEQRYPGTTVYIRKGSEPVEGRLQAFCAHCIGKKRLSILQATTKTVARNREHLCPECKTTYVY